MNNVYQTLSNGTSGLARSIFKFNYSFIKSFCKQLNLPLSPSYRIFSFSPNSGTWCSNFHEYDVSLSFFGSLPNIIYDHSRKCFYFMDFFKFYQLTEKHTLRFAKVKYGCLSISIAFVQNPPLSYSSDLPPLMLKYLSEAVHDEIITATGAHDFFLVLKPSSRYRNFKSQSLYGDNEEPQSTKSSFGIMDVITGAFKGVGFLYSLGLKLVEFPSLFTRTGAFLKSLNSIPLSLASNPSAIICFIAALFRLMHDLSSAFSLSAICFDFLQLLAPLWGHASFKSQSATTFLKILSSFIGIPSDIHSLLLKLYKCAESRHSPIVKAYDIILSLLCKILSFFSSLINKSFPGTQLALSFSKLVDTISFSTVIYEFESTLSVFLTKFNKDQSIIHTPDFRKEAEELSKKLHASEQFLSAILRPEYKYLSSLYTSFKSLLKNIEAFSNPARQVPAFIVLEGPPGCLKSTVLAKVVDHYNSSTPSKSVYSHVWKSLEQGKDFYDDYSNQDVMVLDDVGQGGVSQWAPVMNFVSSIKLPLDCAVAEKKNTLFFTSEYIFCTTNLFSKIQSTTAKDAISDLGALHRRPLVFFFDTSVEPDGSRKIKATVKHYDYHGSKTFVEGLPKYLGDYLVSKQLPNLTTLTGTPSEIAAWIVAMADLQHFHNKNNLIHAKAGFTADDVKKYFSQSDSDVMPDLDVTSSPSSKRYNFSSLYKSFSFFPSLNFSAPNDCEPSEDFSYYSSPAEDKNEILSFAGIKTSFSSAFSLINKSFLPFSNFCLSLFSSLKAFMSKIFSDLCSSVCTTSTSLFEEYPSFKIILSAFFFLATGSLLFFLKRMLSPSIKKTFSKIISPFAPPTPFQSQGIVFDGAVDQTPSSHVFFLVAHTLSGKIRSLCVASGRRLLVSRHSIHQAKYLSMYKNSNEYEANRKMLDSVPYDIIYDSSTSDLCVIQLRIGTDNLFKKARSVFHPPLETPGNSISSCFFSTCDGTIEYSTHQIRPNSENLSVWCESFGKDLIFTAGQGVYHPMSGPGMCGAPLFSKSHGFLGIHVAGNEHKTDYLNGFIAICGVSERQKISGLMLDCGEGLNLESVSGSAMRVRYDKGTVQVKPSLEKSHYYNTGAPILEGVKQKAPPEFKESGISKLKQLVAPNFLLPGELDPKLLKFVQMVIEKDFSKYKVLDWKTVILGGDGLAPLNKDSVNGYGYESPKETYIDFEKGCLQPDYEKYILDLEERILAGKIDFKEMIAYHALKDEPRVVVDGKTKDPRTFAIMPLHFTLLFKKYFGGLFAFVKERRHTNGYAMGLNPYKEWKTVWNNLSSDDKQLFDGDFKWYDRSLIAPFLDSGLASMRKFLDGSDREKKIQRAICDCVVRMFVLVKDELYMITHGLQSGWWLTAFLNSTFNKSISAATFYLNYPRKVDEKEEVFCKRALNEFGKITEYFLGDDRISGVPKDLAPYFNMVTMKKFVESLGMKMTDGLKNEIGPEHKFCKSEDLSFLKRNFVSSSHPAIPLACPLSLDTLGNLFALVDSGKDVRQVMKDRSIVYQIERYLHKDSDLLDEYEASLRDYFSRNNFVWVQFSEERIIEILCDDDGYNVMMSKLGKYVDY